MNTSPPTHPTFNQALKLWLKIGCISFGGPAGQIALMHKELVEDKRWISEGRFLHALNYCMLLPGPEAQQLATYIGWLLHGRWGGLIAGGLFVLPSLLLFWLLGWLYMSFGQLPSAQAILWGIKPVVVALVLAAAWRLASKTLKNNYLRAISLAALLAIVAGLGFVWIVLAAALIGLALYRWQPSLFKTAGHGSSGKSYGASVIDDHSPLATHAQYQAHTWRRALLVSLILWFGSLSAVFFIFGQTHLYNHIAQFFSKAALLTFGGAYAVLPYVNHAVVVDYQWLSQAQMMDGLALGESTPGPLIMIVAFVGFVAGWQQALGNDPLINAMIASSLATFFTFLPSFIFIFLGAPVVEATRHLPKLHAPLTAISAAIVGVIVNLALFMAYHVFWPQGWGNTIDYPALLLAIVACVALLRFNVGVISLLAVCAGIGLVLK
ncbi:chromate efflux transporter [Agitococcus lubricus]|uniref:Chromate transporter n=1 Tax=Agitococcus lubricus TaxID=1077255 RepID=A0A2T5J474_9GAMM|nr:chromate efflux transporter [Agitococcus lubricus]PTQ91410.1 chromate transporter [Agitococcus lubricus]